MSESNHSSADEQSKEPLEKGTEPLANRSQPSSQSTESLTSATEAIEKILPVDEHEEIVSENGQVVRHRGIFLLPNLFTSAALFAGFYAILAAIDGRFTDAGLAIFFGQLLDGMDGRVARMTNTQSKFGQEFDSLSDMVTFGLAPAVIMFMWCLVDFGKVGLAVSFIYVASAAIRLARFNAAAETADNRFFTGLASPPAAMLVVSMVWVAADSGYTPETFPVIWQYVFAFMTACTGFMMIYNVRYSSFKGINFTRRVPVVALLAFILLLVLVSADPPRILFAMAFVYALSAPLIAVWQRLFSRDQEGA